ncbi:hypothetical protein ACIBCC_35885 [Streptomyces griseus]|uniref:hypothetical protein n=1 Tax=Streptomyces griseus TaxID=1911 RepID=UPI00378F5488
MTIPPTVLTTSFYAFYDLHRPAYQAFAAARLPADEAQIVVSHIFSLIADRWIAIVAERAPAAWAWGHLTRAVTRRGGRPTTPAEDIALLRDQLQLTVDQIATLTGTEGATVTALLAAADRTAGTLAGPARHQPATGRPTGSREARWRDAFRLRTALA